MQHFLKGALAASVLALSLGVAQAQDLAPLNSDSEPDRMDWSELDAKFGALPAPAAGTRVGGVSKTLTNEYWRSLGEGYANVATKLGIEFVYQAAQNEGDQLGQLSIAENLFLGNEVATRGVINWPLAFQKTKALLAKVGLDEAP